MKYLLILMLLINTTYADLTTTIIYNWKKSPVIIFDKQVCLLKNNWYKTEDIVDLITIRTMECNNPSWQCISKTDDYWFFQLNKRRHKEAVEKSLELWNNPNELFLYQSSYAINMMNRNRKNCNNDFICIANIYNWWNTYWYIANTKRIVVSNYIYNLINK